VKGKEGSMLESERVEHASGFMSGRKTAVAPRWVILNDWQSEKAHSSDAIMA
jgi:hypothetical protein